jgi:hypothetical protein
MRTTSGIRAPSWRAVQPIGVVLAAVSLGGCIIWPTTPIVYPTIRGRILASGTPVVGARIDRCDGQSAVTSTDTLGRFQIENVRRRAWVTPIFGDPVGRYCFGANAGGSAQQWTGQKVGFVPKEVQVRCELSPTAMRCTEGFDPNY